MTTEQFYDFWKSTYPDTVLLPHYFKHDYTERWFRIHSLPESKRYADDEFEWDILLTRQNIIVTDMFGENSRVLLVTGDYDYNSQKALHITQEEPVFQSYSFVRLDNINLNELDSEEYDEGQVYRPAFTETIWKSHQHDSLLKEIANDRLRAFFVSFNNNIIIAPYDGGVDFVLKDKLTKDFYKEKYKDWLSAREDGY